MMPIEYKDINELILDPDNDRFAELYNGSKKEEDLIEYLLYTESAEEIAQNIFDRKEFYPDEALWVLPLEGGKFIVKDGNRRCAAAKALNAPGKYGLNLQKMQIDTLPVLIYKDEDELNRRIKEQHTHSLFKEWDRIAKALKAFEMHNTGFSDDSIKEIDSNPGQLIKLASFYYEAVKIAGEDLKILLRRGKGGVGGKTIIFERLFSFSELCGYKFKNKPYYQIILTDTTKFTEYINALVAYLKANPSTSHVDVDGEKVGFLKRLNAYGFVPLTSIKPNPTKTNPNQQTINLKFRGSVKKRPVFARKGVAAKLKHLVDECYNLDNNLFSNAKVALARIVFECVLKYTVSETEYNGKKIKDYSHFQPAFYDKGNPRPRKYTNFTTLKEKFIELVKDTGSKNAFKQFDLDQIHQIIHNYKTGAGPNDARTVSENLIPLIEFMLQEPTDLIASLDTTKLI